MSFSYKYKQYEPKSFGTPDTNFEDESIGDYLLRTKFKMKDLNCDTLSDLEEFEKVFIPKAGLHTFEFTDGKLIEFEVHTVDI